MQQFYDLLSTITDFVSAIVDDLLNPDSELRSILDLIVAIIAIGGGLGFVFSLISNTWRKVLSPYREYKRFVDRVYSKEIRKAISKYYIPTRAQDIDPCEYEEIRENNGNFISQLLVPFFCDEAFKKTSQGKYYLVLADSGMGKTTFLLRLFRECLLNRSIQKRYNVRLVPLSQDNCLQAIKAIEDQENTILLLDALDENRNAIKNYESFFAELINSTEGFARIVLTCRTQFFPNRAAEPVETGKIRVGTGNKREEIIKKYISPFSDEEVKLYLKKQYKFNKRKQKEAYEIVTKVPVLMARPVILNWMNFLCDSREDFSYSYQIYSTIIDKWIEREALGHTDRSLFTLSRSIADYMFKNEETSMSASKVEEIAAKKNLQLEPIIAKSRSLLNRNGNGEYKFAHRSFLEYFIVFGVFERMKLPENLPFFFSFSGVKRFLFEILIDSAQKTDQEDYQKSVMLFDRIKPHINNDSLIDFLNNKRLNFSAVNHDNGFEIQAKLLFNKEEINRSIIYVSDKIMADISQPGLIEFKPRKLSAATISIISKPGDSHPHTKISVSSDLFK